jgi:hypothetical protein
VRRMSKSGPELHGYKGQQGMESSSAFVFGQFSGNRWRFYGQVVQGCVFRIKGAGRSDPSPPQFPIRANQAFRLKTATDSDSGRPLLRAWVSAEHATRGAYLSGKRRAGCPISESPDICACRSLKDSLTEQLSRSLPA